MIDLPGLETTNTDLASALCAVGIPLKKGCPVRLLTGDAGDRRCFFFEPISPCGKYVTRDLMLAWQDPAWHERNPEHPFAYLKCAADNRRYLLDYIKSSRPIALIEKRGKMAFIPVNASDGLQQKIFDRLNKAR